MKKLLPLLVVIILIMSGIGVIAIPIDKQIENKPISTQDWKLVIETKPKLSKYNVKISNDGTETLKGNLTITIATHGKMVLGREFLWPPDEPYDINMGAGESETISLGPLLGIGSVSIVVEAVLLTDEDDYYKSVEANGFALLILVLFNIDPLIIP